MDQQDCEIEQLRRIDCSALEVGRRLPGHLRDHCGKVLIPAGRVLTAIDLAKLEASAPHGPFAGPEWVDPPVAPGPAGAEALATPDKQGSSPGGRDLRQHERHVWAAWLTVELEETTDLGVRRWMIRVITCDVSIGGFAFTYHRYVHPGTRVRAHFDALPGKPKTVGIVRHCTHTGGARYRVGVQFLDMVREGHRQQC